VVRRIRFRPGSQLDNPVSAALRSGTAHYYSLFRHKRQASAAHVHAGTFPRQKNSGADAEDPREEHKSYKTAHRRRFRLQAGNSRGYSRGACAQNRQAGQTGIHQERSFHIVEDATSVNGQNKGRRKEGRHYNRRRTGRYAEHRRLRLSRAYGNDVRRFAHYSDVQDKEQHKIRRTQRVHEHAGSRRLPRLRRHAGLFRLGMHDGHAR